MRGKGKDRNNPFEKMRENRDDGREKDQGKGFNMSK